MVIVDCSPHSRRQQGFTLVEILVAMLVMAVLSVLAYNAFDGILRMENRSKVEFLAENRRSLASAIILNDLIHMRPRPVRDQLGGVRPAYAAPSNEYVVEFTRGGLPDFDTMRGGIQRLAYRVEGGRLIRTTWRTADAGSSPQPRDQVLAAGVEAMAVEQLDGQGRFTPLWPPVNVRAAPEALPAMVRVTLTLEQGEDMVLLIPGSGGYRSALTAGFGDQRDL